MGEMDGLHFDHTTLIRHSLCHLLGSWLLALKLIMLALMVPLLMYTYASKPELPFVLRGVPLHDVRKRYSWTLSLLS